MKVLLINTLYYPHLVGGAERSVQLLAEWLKEFGHDVVVVALAPSGEESVHRVNGVRVYYTVLKNLYYPFGKETNPSLLRKAMWHAWDSYNPWMYRSVKRILDKENPDLVHTHNLAGFSVAVWRAAKECALPIVHTTRDYYLLCPRSHMFRGGQNCCDICISCKPYANVRKHFSRLVNAAVGVSYFILNVHTSHGYFPSAQKSVIYNACVLPKHTEEKQVEYSRPLRFGYLGRLHPTKGVHRLLEAFLRLNPGIAELWIAGKGDESYEKTLKRTSEGRNDIRWLGFVSPDELLRNVDILIVPSLWQEPFARVPIEALAYGVPVLVSNRGGSAELAFEGAVWTFDPEEPGALEALMEKCISERRKLREWSIQARERAKLFSPEAVASKYLNVYQTVLSCHRRT